MNTVIVCLLVAILQVSCASADAGEYYKDIDTSAKDDDLKGSLQKLIAEHAVLSYDKVWNALDEINKQAGCPQNSTYIPDVYSSYCWKPELDTEGGECGNYKKEGDCFNREHLWPKSWFGGFDKGEGAQTDLWELYPSDGYVNGLRGNLPLGPITCEEDATYVSSNGSKIGPCDPTAADGDYHGACFEPADSLKGDFARSYFYLATAYWNKWECCNTDAVNGSDIKPWNEAVLRAWHDLDAVDDGERSKNDVIFDEYQHNRNPFVDHPEWVAQIGDF